VKKPILVAVLVFLAVFLLWPTSKDGSGDCGASRYVNCAPATVLEGPGGGIRYIKHSISTGQFDLGRQTMTDEHDRGFFNPSQAISIAVIAGLIAGFSVRLSKRLKRR